MVMPCTVFKCPVQFCVIMSSAVSFGINKNHQGMNFDPDIAHCLDGSDLDPTVLKCCQQTTLAD